MTKQKIQTQLAPPPSGTYSQAIQVGNIIYFAGQIPLDPQTGQLISDDFAKQAEKVFDNLKAVCEASHTRLDDIVKLTIYLTNLAFFPIVNDVMRRYFKEPYPARTTIQVSALPMNVQIEVEAITVKNTT